MRPFVLAAVVGLVPSAAAGQLPQIRGYYLNVAFAADGTPLTDGALSDFQRVRVMTAPTYGPVAFDVAYEHRLTVSTAEGTGPLLGLQPAEGGGDWLPLQGTIADQEHLLWRHRVDRLSVELGGETFAVVAGRQPVSWATTLFLTPADPFMPFDPSDPFREFRRGVDALRVRGFPGPMSELEAVVRPATIDDETSVTALARGRTAMGPLDLSGWGGVVHDEASAALGVTVTSWGAAWRGEGVLRRAGDSTITRFTLGVDRSFPLGVRTLYVAVEYQHDGFGAANAAELQDVVLSAPARRGELQVYGRDEAVVQASVDLHPLVATDVLVIWNFGDASALLAPGASYSVSNDVSMRGGVFIGLGADLQPDGALGSEYGLLPLSGYVSLTAFF